MFSSDLEGIVDPKEKRGVPLHSLMPHRVRDVLLVSSIYDSFTFEEDAGLTEILFSQYIELNLRFAPNVERVSTAHDALDRLRKKKYDLVISMTRVGDLDIRQFCMGACRIDPDLPVVLLAYNTREVPMLEPVTSLPGIDRLFVWHGDARLFLAIIKYVEDRLNVDHDAEVAGVRSIILVEDTPQFYSSYLPLLYTELVQQTQGLMSDGLNRTQVLMRMRARPKILLATTYEEGVELYEKYRDYVLGLILDASFPRDGKLDRTAGLDFARMVKDADPTHPVLVQSSDGSIEDEAVALGAHFINKHSPSLLRDVRDFMRENLGFGDFIFRTPDGKPVAKARHLNELIGHIRDLPHESLLYHARRNDFSTWLMARTEFDLAKALRPRKVEEFADPEDIRQYLVNELDKYRLQQNAGVIADFSAGAFDAASSFVRIGSGSLGGKGRGLAFIHSLLEKYNIEEHVPGVRIYVPPSAVLATGIFERFMDDSGLSQVALSETSDANIANAFLAADLPYDAVDALREFLREVTYPIAVRSSSQLEDASYQPFAGIYSTYMLPNNHKDLEFRLAELCNAVKLVYASTYYSNTKAYLESTPNRLEEEKMAVVIQQIVGRRHDGYIYPDIAGVARSFDYYPMEGMRPEDGVASVALGLGNTVVDGGRSVRFSPAYPNKLYQFSTLDDYLEYAQREFAAIDLSARGPRWDIPDGSESNIEFLGLDVAEAHGTLTRTGSVYSPENEAVYDGVYRDGVRLVTMAGVLKDNEFPLAEVLAFILKIGGASFSCPVEIEFAATIGPSRDGPHEFGFLQIRPLTVLAETADISLDDVDTSQAICLSHNALGHGYFDGIQDIIYVPSASFSIEKTRDIAAEIEKFNLKFRQTRRNYLLIGPGRWGTSDQWAGIPVNWAQISSVRCIIETDIDGVSFPPSQGTHFFHNITSLGVGYLTVYSTDEKSTLDTSWLDGVEPLEQGEYVRHLHFADQLEIIIDGRQRTGVIMKPGSRSAENNSR